MCERRKEYIYSVDPVKLARELYDILPEDVLSNILLYLIRESRIQINKLDVDEKRGVDMKLGLVEEDDEDNK